VSPEDLKEVVHRDISPTTKLLACMAIDGPKTKTVKSITTTALDCGLRQVQKWNVSQLLARAKGLAIRTPQGWELTAAGRRVLENCSALETPAFKLLPQLRQQTARIKNDQTRAFIRRGNLLFRARPPSSRRSSNLDWRCIDPLSPRRRQQPHRI